MKKVIFVCLGNICRSPMAQMMFQDLINKEGLASDFDIQSMSTSNYEIGNPPHPGAIEELKKMKVPILEHVGHQISRDDFMSADVIIGMDEQNIVDLKQMSPAEMTHKIFMAYDVLGRHQIIQDPWFDHKFDRTYQQLQEVLPAWMDKLSK